MHNIIAAVSIATYNILDPFYAVYWAEPAGLNEEGLAASRETLRASAQTMDKSWETYSNWNQRQETVAKNIQSADIVCLQEVSETTLANLQELTNYQLAAVSYSHIPGLPSFGNAILYNKEKVNLEEGSVLTCESPPAIRGAAVGIFKIGTKLIKVASLHLTGYYSKEPDLIKKQASKKRGFDELQNFKRQIESQVQGLDGIVIAGDLNESKDEEEQELYRPGVLMEAGYLCDNCFSATEPLKNRKIDWLFFKSLKGEEPALTPLGLEELKQASDHLMSGTGLEWRN